MIGVRAVEGEWGVAWKRGAKPCEAAARTPLTEEQRRRAAEYWPTALKTAEDQVRKCKVGRWVEPDELAAVVAVEAGRLGLPPGKKLRSWLRTIASGRLTDLLRRRHGRRGTPRYATGVRFTQTFTDLDAFLAPCRFEVEGWTRRIDQILVDLDAEPVDADLQRRDWGKSLARKLPKTLQAAFLEHFIESPGETMAQTGERVGVCESRVSQILTQSLRILREEASLDDLPERLTRPA